MSHMLACCICILLLHIARLLLAFACCICIVHLRVAIMSRVRASHFRFLTHAYRHDCILSRSRFVALALCCACALLRLRFVALALCCACALLRSRFAFARHVGVCICPSPLRFAFARHVCVSHLHVARLRFAFACCTCFCVLQVMFAFRVCMSRLHCALACCSCFVHLRVAIMSRICTSHFRFVALAFHHARAHALSRYALTLRRACALCLRVARFASPLACVVRRTFSHAILSFAACQGIRDLRSAR